jgi:large subunit ribosomal protein L17
MRKNVFGRKFKRDTNERKGLFKSLISSLILKDSIKTTSEKAKAIKGDIDRLVNKAKKEEQHLRIQHLQKSLGKKVIEKLTKEIAPRLKDRTSGYTKIIKLGRRFSDNAEMVTMEWTNKSAQSLELLPRRQAGKAQSSTKVEKADKVEKAEKNETSKKGKKK